MTVVGSVGDETTIVDQWLQATLAGDSALIAFLPDGTDGVHADEAPPAAKFPLVIHQFQAGTDVRGSGPYRIMTNGLWIVKAVGETRDRLTIKPIADRIDVLLQAASGAAADGLVFSSVREFPFRLNENENGHDYRHLGGGYRCLAQIPST